MDSFDEASQNQLFDELKEFKVDVERDHENYVALSLELDGDYNAVYDKLSKLEKESLLEFETCEAKVKGSFDDVSEESE